ncbi:MAG: ASCH domain-containing protein [Gemmataceae bacterium]
MEKQLRALSVRQPYAEMIFTGEKDIEYRGRQTHIRGQVYVYACKAREPAEAYEDAGVDADRLNHGMIVGTVEIVDCKENEDGEFEWHLANPRRLRKPLAVRGVPQPGFFWPFGRPVEKRRGKATRGNGQGTK